MKTLTGGSFQDAHGTVVANGIITLTISQAAVVAGTNQVVPSLIQFTLDGSGNMPAAATVWGNDEVLPAGTSYTVYVYNSFGQVVYGPITWVIAGSSPINVATMVPTSSTVFYPTVGSSFTQINTTFSATPTFSVSTGATFFTITLTGNVTSSTLSVTAAAPMLIAFEIIQDGTGGRTFAWPSNVKNASAPNGTANSRTFQLFLYDGSNAYPLGPATYN